jgi:hypothetical protein
MRLRDRLYCWYMRARGKPVYFLFVPTKEGIEQMLYLNTLGEIDPHHTLVTPSPCGEHGIWVVDRKNIVSGIIGNWYENPPKDHIEYPVKHKWWQKDYKERLRSTIIEATKGNDTVH